MIQGDVNGQLLPDNDDAQIDTIRLLKENLAARRRDGRAARLMAKQQYDRPIVAQRYMGLFRQAVTNRANRQLQFTINIPGSEPQKLARKLRPINWVSSPSSFDSGVAT